MKQRYAKLKSVAFAALTTMGLALGAQAENVSYVDTDGTTKQVDATVVESSDERVTWGTGWYVVNGDVAITGGADCTGEVKLILADGKKLTISGVEDQCAGIGVSGDGVSFTVYGQSEGTGALVVTGGNEGAGIGGGYEGAGSHITINGGTVKATGGEDGAGIGGGGDGAGSDITINGGTVTATGGYGGAGIGGGRYCAGSDITISGGDVTATGGNNGAGIGGGIQGAGSHITISGGTVTATGGYDGAGIGGGSSGAGSHIMINGGTVTATGGTAGAGIGGGGSGAGSNITISGGDVTATGGEDGAGIGGGRRGSVSAIYVADNIVLKEDGDNPPNTVIPHKSATTDISSSLGGKRYATAVNMVTFSFVCPSGVSVDSVTNIEGVLTAPYAAVPGSDVWVTYKTDNGKFFADCTGVYTKKVQAVAGEYPASTCDKAVVNGAVVELGGDMKATVLEGGACIVSGSGALTKEKADLLKDQGVTNLVIGAGVTGVGENAFEGWRSLRDVQIGADCTTVGARAFNKCYNVTNVTCAAGASVGDYAFLRCNSLETLSFGSGATFGQTPFALYAGIYMKEDGIPEIYAIPSVTVAGKTQVLQGSTDLKAWTDITEESQKANYNFFRIVLKDAEPK